jgi:hypothetical protein
MNLKNWDEAASHVGFSVKDLKNAVRHGRGPAYFKPTPQRVLFAVEDLDAWVAGWKRITAIKADK